MNNEKIWTLNPRAKEFEYQGPTSWRTFCFVAEDGHLFWVRKLTLMIFIEKHKPGVTFREWSSKLDSKEK